MYVGLGTVALAAHTIVKQITDFCLGLLGTFSTVSQALVASCLGKVPHQPLLLRDALSSSEDHPNPKP